MAPMPPPMLPHASQSVRAAARHGDLKELKECLAKGMHVNDPDDDGSTPLLMAVCYGHIECVEALLEAGADPSLSGKHGITPVFFACQEGHVSCLTQLIAKGGDLNTPNSQDGGTPLYIASSKNNAECVELLIHAGADVNKSRLDGSTALQTAIKKGHKKVAGLLIAGGADVEAKLPPHGKTPFLMAMEMMHAGDTNMRKEYLAGMFFPAMHLEKEMEALRAENKQLKQQLAAAAKSSSPAGSIASKRLDKVWKRHEKSLPAPADTPQLLLAHVVALAALTLIRPMSPALCQARAKEAARTSSADGLGSVGEEEEAEEETDTGDVTDRSAAGDGKPKKKKKSPAGKKTKKSPTTQVSARDSARE